MPFAHTLTRTSIGSQTVPSTTAAGIRSNGVGTRVSTTISIEATFVDIWMLEVRIHAR